MKRACAALIALPLLFGCVEEPTVKEAEKAVEAIDEDEVKETRKSIVEAAEEATKLVEADAKEEIDALEPKEQETE